MNGDIKLSEKHGMNPAMEICFFCMKERGVVLFGKLKDDVEAPRRVVVDKVPCDECKGHMERGVILISADAEQTTDQQDPYRSGGWVVVTEDAVRRMFNTEHAEQMIKKRAGFVEDEAWDHFGLPRGEQEIEA